MPQNKLVLHVWTSPNQNINEQLDHIEKTMKDNNREVNFEAQI